MEGGREGGRERDHYSPPVSICSAVRKRGREKVSECRLNSPGLLIDIFELHLVRGHWEECYFGCQEPACPIDL